MRNLSSPFSLLLFFSRHECSVIANHVELSSFTTTRVPD
jgi:hypothetical protein